MAPVTHQPHPAANSAIAIARDRPQAYILYDNLKALQHVT
jgi:hypothetical protein